MARTDVRGYEINLIVLAMPVGDARPVQVVGRHLEVDLVADADADEIFAHFAGNMREHLMAVGQGHPEHRAGQHLPDDSR